MSIKNITIGFVGFVLLSAVCPLAKDWKLLQGTKVKETGPRTYRFTVDYISLRGRTNANILTQGDA